MATFMKGDTFLEVASCLARTDIHDAALCNFALEVVKRYVRSKIKKGKGKEVGGPKGKLEELERKYAHLGYQDIFYLTRLQLGLPPSTLDLGRPTSPCRKILVRAKFPLDPKYQLPLEDTASLRLSAAMSRSAGPSNSGSTSQQGAAYAESSRSVPSGSRTALGGAGPEVLRRPLIDREDSRGRSRERRDTNMRSPALGPTPFIVAPTPPEGRRESETLPKTPEALPIPGRSPLHQAETRDLFDHSVDLGTPLPPPFLGAHGRTHVKTPPVPIPKRGGRAEPVQEDDVDVRRMLEARIQALTTALKSLDASKSSADLSVPPPAAAPVPVTDAHPPRVPLLRMPSGSRRYIPPASPPPDVPLPPLPTTMPSTRTAPSLAISSPRLRLNGTPPLTPATPVSPGAAAVPSSVLDMHVRGAVSPTTRTSAPTSPGNEGIFELDPEIAKDPFGSPTRQLPPAHIPRLVKPTPLYGADPALATNKTSHARAGRETAAFARSQDDLRRVRAMNGYDNGRQTPPPQYER